MAIASHHNTIVAGGISVSPIPAIPIIPSVEFMLNGTAYDMNIDGSTTAQEFKYAPSSGETKYLEHVTFFMDDTGSTPPDKFGAINGGLTNGLQVFIKRDGTEYEVVNLKNNGDVSLSFNYSVGQFEGGSFLALSNGFGGKMIFATNITLMGDDGDEIKFKVRDDLTGLTYLRASCQVWERES